ncbi:hypothetical protein HMPREF9071_0638 [Capnocytophaga sp. oral taxon 338 str. F0234]|nr:hypothetical protein HMPREF9071_0638 [Capnocytophaga sp. oral taxon 338 str. F0234]
MYIQPTPAIIIISSQIILSHHNITYQYCNIYYVLFHFYKYFERTKIQIIMKNE